MTSDTIVSDFLDLACLSYADGESPRRIKRAVTLLQEHPGLATTSIYTAAATGNATGIASMLAATPESVNQPGGPRDWPPLMYLCYSRISERDSNGDMLATAQLLLDQGADANAFYMWGETYRFTALTGAIGEGEMGRKSQPPHEHAMELATKLLDAGANPNDGQGLYNSMFHDDDRWLKLLLNRGLTPNHAINWKTDNPTRTMDFVLGHAVQCGFTDRVALLLAHGADPNSLNHYNGRKHYTNAIASGFSDIAMLLEQHGAEPETLSTEQAFRAACMAANRETAAGMLEEDPSLIKDQSLLADASANDLPEAVELLIDLGADIDAFSKAGNTALHQAAWRGNLEVVKTLVAHGAQLLRDRTHDATPAGWAGYAGQAEALAFLIEYSDDIFDLVSYGIADVLAHALDLDPDLANARDKFGNTTVHYVADERTDAGKILDLLAKHGADFNIKNDAGKKPLDLALAAGAADIVAALRNHGATPTNQSN